MTLLNLAKSETRLKLWILFSSKSHGIRQLLLLYVARNTGAGGFSVLHMLTGMGLLWLGDLVFPLSSNKSCLLSGFGKLILSPNLGDPFSYGQQSQVLTRRNNSFCCLICASHYHFQMGIGNSPVLLGISPTPFTLVVILTNLEQWPKKR